MPNKSLKKRIASLTQRIKEHEAKIEKELEKESADYGAIHHWQAEIRAFSDNRERILRRLSG